MSNSWSFAKFSPYAHSLFQSNSNYGLTQASAYRNFGGEVEAYNATRRSKITEDERKKSFPLDTQDTPSKQQFIFDHKGKPFSRNSYSNGFMTQADLERFNQLHYHGTGHVILDNRFDLRYLHSGEGSNMFGAGFYFAEHPAVAESYRRSECRKILLLYVLS